MRLFQMSGFAALSALLLAGISSRALAADSPKPKMEILDDEPEAGPLPKAQPKPQPPPAKQAAQPPKTVTAVQKTVAPSPPPKVEEPPPPPPATAMESKADAKPAESAEKPAGAGGDVGPKPASAAMLVEDSADSPGSLEAPPPVPVGDEKAAIAEYIRDQASDIHRCYQRRLDDRPTLQGKLYVIMYIGRDGRVIGATTSGMSDSEMVRCVLPIVRKWEFAKPASGGKLMVKYPFVFKPQASR